MKEWWSANLIHNPTQQAVESQVPLLWHFHEGLKRTYYQESVVWGVLFKLFWIFEYITAGLFARPLSADFPDVKNSWWLVDETGIYSMKD